jgi:hypothetical protein
MKTSLTARLAEFFRARPNAWHDGREIAGVAGVYGWRSRISDLRRPPFFMNVINRQRRVRGPTGPYVISEYLFQEAREERRAPVEEHPSRLQF